MAEGLVRVAIVDDHASVREGLDVLLSRRGCRVVGTATDAEEALTTVDQGAPEVVVIDLHLPGESGLSLTRRLLADKPQLGVVVYTGVDDAALLGDALETGARGFVLKLGPLGELVDAIRAVRRGDRYVDDRFKQLLESDVAGERLLSKREREVFALLAQGLSGAQIAVRLHLSSQTVRTHIRNAMTKLEARTRTHAVVDALQRGEIRPVAPPRLAPPRTSPRMRDDR